MTTDVQSETVDRLTGARLPEIALPTTDGGAIYLSKLPGTTIVYLFPRISPEGGTSIVGWDELPGAKGCTSQSCGFRNYSGRLWQSGVENIFGLSAQPISELCEAVQRLNLGFPLLNDETLAFQRTLDLPIFTIESMTMLQRMTLILRDGVIDKVFYPVLDPSTNAAEVHHFLNAQLPAKR